MNSINLHIGETSPSLLSSYLYHPLPTTGRIDRRIDRKAYIPDWKYLLSMSEAVKGRHRIFHVTNRGSDSESSGEETPIQNSIYHPPPLSRPIPLTPSPLTTNIRAPRYQPSHNSLSSPSSTSSPAAEETPPPSTPGVSGHSLDLTADDPAIASSSYEPPASRPKFHLFNKFKQKSNPKRPLNSPNQDERILILVTADSERYVNVEITGAKNPAYIRECVFTKVRNSLSKSQDLFI